MPIKAVADDDEGGSPRRVADSGMLEENNLILVLETHGKEHGTGRKLAQHCPQNRKPRVKLNYDTANVIFYGGVDPHRFENLHGGNGLYPHQG